MVMPDVIERDTGYESDEDGPQWSEHNGLRDEIEDAEFHDDGLSEHSDWFPEEA